MTLPVPCLAYGLVQGQPLFLDLEADSYFLLADEEDAVAPAPIGASARRAGLPAEAEPTSPDLPPASLLDQEVRPRFSTAVLQLWLTRRRVRRQLSRRPLASILADLQKPRSGAFTSRRSVAHDALAFARARPLIPGQPHCLLDSLCLLSWLKHRMASATLVFGAKLDPFAAHCWVEGDGMLLNDRLDTVEKFTPILRLPC